MSARNAFIVLTSLVAAASCGDGNVVCPDGKVLVGDSVCADPELTCAEGTVEHDGECVAYDPNDQTAPTTTADPPGSVSLGPPEVVVLTADEPATVYYTLDGSEPTTGSPHAPSPVSVFDVAPDGELKFFAIDLAGNEGEVATETYAVDDEAPSPVTNLSAVVQGSETSITWENPSDPDFAGVVVLRSVVAPVFEPVIAEEYAEGPVGEGEDVLYVGTESTHTDSAPFPGFDRYTVWTYDELGNYSAPVWATTPFPIPVPEQTGTLTIDTATGTVDVTQQPANFVLDGEATVDLAQQQIDLTVHLESGVARPFFNTKLLFDSISDGAAVGDGMLGGIPYLHYGVRAMATGETRTAETQLTGVTGGSGSVTVDVRLRDDPVIVHVAGSYNGGIGLADSSEVGATASVSCSPVAWEGPFGGRRCSYRDAVFSQDGRFIYASNGWRAKLAQIDSSTLSAVATVDLHPAGGVGSVSSLARSPDGKFIYAVVTLDGHYRGSGTVQGQGGPRVVDLVKLDAANLVELDRVNLLMAGQTSVRMRNLSLDAEGKYAATASLSLSTLFFIDLEAMSVAGSVNTASFAAGPGAVAVEPDGSAAWVAPRFSSAGVYRVDRATLEWDEVTLTDSISGPGQLAFAPDGLLYFGRKFPSSSTRGLAIIDADNLTEIGIDYTYQAIKGIGFSADGTKAYLSARDLGAGQTVIATFDVATRSPIGSFPAHGGADRGGHWLGLSPF
jgi:hypothetical protein